MRRTIGCYVLCILFSLFCFVSLTTPAAAENDKNSDPGYIFYKGNALYENEHYDEAIAEYSTMLEQGMESGNLYYNLGNCYFRKGELGKAILNYERAARLIPRDSDLKANHKYAQSQIKANISEMSLSWSGKLTGVLKFLSMDELTILSSVLFLSIIVVLTVRLFAASSGRSYILLLCIVICAFIFSVISLTERVSALDKEAVVVSETSDARFEPFESATTHFTLHEGMKITITHIKNDWIRIKRPDGKTGWIKKQAIEII